MATWWLRWQKIDWPLMGAISMLLLLSTVMMYSINYDRFIKQLIIVLISLASCFIIMQLDYRWFHNYAYVWYVTGIIILVAVLLFGSTIRGTTGWFQIGSFGLQPVEFVKIILLFALARFFSDRAFNFSAWRTVALSAVLPAGYMVLVLLQPDLGSTAVLIVIFLALLCLTNVRWQQIVVIVIVGLGCAALAWLVLLQDYQKDRLLTFIDSSRDPLRSGYNVTQAVVAVGSGQWFGRGLGLGTQSQLEFLPERETDFIFAVIAEELGLFGAGSVIVLLGIIIWRLWLCAQRQPDSYSTYYVLGLIILIVIHSVINIGMNIGVMPVTGLPLPFVSAGGSSLLALLLAIGIVQNVHSQTRN
ncbi:MAG: rod shape-determining protein RodA [Candidatus Kerfeldbacteria bacterium]|nr:rod shape-determining protein RodA [Candidatus Kerfeldbacteria bacterium]